MPAIPERQPIADPFTGMVLRLDQTHLLARTPQPGTEAVIWWFVMAYSIWTNRIWRLCRV
jgi:hypothetical protein